jgi:hypothetical protein
MAFRGLPSHGLDTPFQPRPRIGEILYGLAPCSGMQWQPVRPKHWRRSPSRSTNEIRAYSHSVFSRPRHAAKPPCPYYERPRAVNAHPCHNQKEEPRTWSSLPSPPIRYPPLYAPQGSRRTRPDPRATQGKSQGSNSLRWFPRRYWIGRIDLESRSRMTQASQSQWPNLMLTRTVIEVFPPPSFARLSAAIRTRRWGQTTHSEMSRCAEAPNNSPWRRSCCEECAGAPGSSVCANSAWSSAVPPSRKFLYP